MELSSAQKEIATAGVDNRLLVLAGPGTGKTHTLLQRLIHLVEVEGLHPRSELLVLSFSRAAVAEIRARLARLAADSGGTGPPFINIHTFDSFATRLLSALEEDLDLSGKSYDARIALAVQRIEDPDSASSEALSSIRHIVVDEIQDLVGVRARLVLGLLKRVGGGFTLLGDPGQAIYDYLVARPGDGPTATEFLKTVQTVYADGLSTRSLGHNYRARGSSTNVAAQTRALVVAEQEPDPESLVRLRRLVSELPAAGSLDTPVGLNQPGVAQGTAILCRTNADVLFTCQALRAQAIPGVIPTRAEEQGLPPWIGRILSTHTTPRMTEGEFLKRWQTLVGGRASLSPETAWHALLIAEGRGRADLDCQLLRRQLARGLDWAFESEALALEHTIPVQTIHGSKGREFDRVAIVPPEPRASRNADPIEEARVLYVAATRARDTLLRLDRQGMPVQYGRTNPSGRTRLCGQSGSDRHDMEVGVDGDVLSAGFVSAGLFNDSRLAMQAQEALWRRAEPGSTVGLRRVTSGGEARYAIMLYGEKRTIPIGLMDPAFGADLSAHSRAVELDGRARLRSEYTGLFVVERQTVVIAPGATGISEPFATSGFGLGVSIKGTIQVR